nr:uncharacterized mitochondrial protein AtMg00810-like [Tanacetum cinerariifolium]
MIGSLMYLTASRPDIMFAICACAWHQVTLKECHLHAVKRIFRYLKGHPKLGLWYPKASSFDLVAYSDSDYGGAFQDSKSTTRGSQFLGRRLISCQYKKKTIVATSTIEAKYVAAASCCGRDRSKVVLAFTSFFFFCISSVVKVIVLPSFVLESAGSWEQPSLAVGTYTSSGNSLLSVGMPCAFYSQQKTPLFLTMMVQTQEELGEGLANPSDPHHTPTIIQPSTSQPQRKQKPRKTKRQDTKLPQTSGPTTNVVDEAVNKEMDNSFVRAATTASSLEAKQDSGNVNKTQFKTTPNEPGSQGTSSGGGPRCQDSIRDTIAQTRFENVLDLENTKITQVLEIDMLTRRVKKLERRKRSRTHRLKRLYKVRLSERVEFSKDEGLGEEDASKQRMIADIEANEDI